MISTLAIHQPDFFPWLGFFHKVSLVDLFYLFDHVQVPRGKGYHSRVKILFQEDDRWLTIPIIKSGRSDQSYSEAIIDNSQDYEKSHLGILQQAYSSTPHYDEVIEVVENNYVQGFDKLAEFNINFIKDVSDILELDTDFVRTSDIAKENGELYDLDGNDLVLELAKLSQCNKYISGTGCKDFIRPDTFESVGIEFIFQKFEHPVYRQIGSAEFIPGLSIIDAAMHMGWDEIKKIFRKQSLDKWYKES